MCHLVVRVSVYSNIRIRTEPSVGEPNSHLARFLHQTKSQAQTAEKNTYIPCTLHIWTGNKYGKTLLIQ